MSQSPISLQRELSAEVSLQLIEGLIEGRSECLDLWSKLKGSLPVVSVQMSIGEWGDLEEDIQAVYHKGELVVDLRKVF